MLNIDIPALHFYVDEDNEIVIEEMEVMPDHVHVLISFPPSEVPPSAIKALKDRSAFIFLRRTRKFGGPNPGAAIYDRLVTVLARQLI